MTLCSILVILISFGMGIIVGYRRAVFASNWNQNYNHNFYGMPMPGFMRSSAEQPPPFNPHGVVGEVIDVGSSSISVQDSNGNEQSVFVATATPIRDMDDTIPLMEIQVGDHVTIIGEPNDNGQVEARFIRVVEESSATP